MFKDCFIIASDNKVLETKISSFDNTKVFSWSETYPFATPGWQFMYFLTYEDAKTFLETDKIFNKYDNDGHDIFPPSALHRISGVGYNDEPVDVTVHIVKLEAQSRMIKHFPGIEVKEVKNDFPETE